MNQIRSESAKQKTLSGLLKSFAQTGADIHSTTAISAVASLNRGERDDAGLTAASQKVSPEITQASRTMVLGRQALSHVQSDRDSERQFSVRRGPKSFGLGSQ